MSAIEKMLTGHLEMAAFIKLLKTDESLRGEIRSFVPSEAIHDSKHAFWKDISHSVLEQYDFDFLKLLFKICRFDGTLGDNLNIFSTISCAYYYYVPHLSCTDYYQNAFRLYLEAIGEYYEGPEVTQLLNQIVSDALQFKTKEQKIKEIRSKLKCMFHIDGTKRPYWIQGGEWPMGKYSPMQFIKQEKITEGKQYIFQDVDTGETRLVRQYY